MLTLIVFNNRLKLLQLAFSNRRTDLIFKARNPHIIDGLNTGQFKWCDWLAGGALDNFQQAFFTRRNKQNRLTTATGTASTTNAMGITLRIVRHIVIDHMTDAFHIQTAGRNVGRDQNVDLAVFELPDGAFALRLLNITVDCRS